MHFKLLLWFYQKAPESQNIIILSMQLGEDSIKILVVFTTKTWGGGLANY